jgi:hypothetical protein
VYRNENMKRLDERRKRLGVSDQSWQRERSTDGGSEPTARDDAAHMCVADGDAMTCVHEVLSISRRCVEVAAAWMLATCATGVMVFWMLWILSQANPATAQPVTLAMPDASPLAWVAEMQLSPPEVRRPDSVERAWIGLEQAVGSTLAPSGLHAKLGPDYAVAVALVGEEPRAFARSRAEAAAAASAMVVPTTALCLMVAWPVCDARLSVEPYSRGLPPVRLPYLSQAPLAQVSSQLQPLARWHVPPRPARLLQPSPGPSLTTVFALASPPGHHLSMVALLAALGPWPAPGSPPAVAARPGRCAAFAPGCGLAEPLSRLAPPRPSLVSLPSLAPGRTALHAQSSVEAASDDVPAVPAVPAERAGLVCPLSHVIPELHTAFDLLVPMPLNRCSMHDVDAAYVLVAGDPAAPLAAVAAAAARDRAAVAAAGARAVDADVPAGAADAPAARVRPLAVDAADAAVAVVSNASRWTTCGLRGLPSPSPARTGRALSALPQVSALQPRSLLRSDSAVVCVCVSGRAIMMARRALPSPIITARTLRSPPPATMRTATVRRRNRLPPDSPSPPRCAAEKEGGLHACLLVTGIVATASIGWLTGGSLPVVTQAVRVWDCCYM